MFAGDFEGGNIVFGVSSCNVCPEVAACIILLKFTYFVMRMKCLLVISLGGNIIYGVSGCNVCP